VEKSGVIDEETCHGCFNCMLKCPHGKAKKSNPIKRIPMVLGEEFSHHFLDNAYAVIKSFGAEKIRYINFALDMTVMCDCVSNPGMRVVPDLGIFGSIDPVAVDMACVDAEINAPGLPTIGKNGEWKEAPLSGVEKFSASGAMGDVNWSLDAAVKNKLGSKDYELIKI